MSWGNEKDAVSVRLMTRVTVESLGPPQPGQVAGRQ